MASLATEQTFVTNVYKNILFRSSADIASTSTANDINTWANLIVAGVVTESQVSTAASQGEATTLVLPIVSLYEGLYHRAPDAAGLALWVQDFRSGDSLTNIAQSFSKSTEFTSLYGATPSAGAFVTALYANILGRLPDAAGLAAWTATLGGSSTSIPTVAQMANLALIFTQSKEYLANSTVNIQNWLTGGVLGTYASTINGFGGVSGSGSTTGQTFTFTTGVDNLTGTSGNDTFIADNTGATKTFGVVDSVNGNGGSDTLKIYDAAADAIDGLAFGTISSIANLYLNNGTLTTTKTFDATALTSAGVTSVEVDSPATLANGSTFTFKLASSESLKLDKVNTAAAGIGTINLATATGVTSVGLTVNAVGTDTTATGVVKFDVTSTSVTTLNLTASGAASKVTVDNTGAALTALTIAGNQNLTVTEGTANPKSIDASSSSGNVTVDTSANTLNAAFTFKGGTGNDNLILKAGALDILTAGSQLAAGTGGTNTLTINDTAPSTTAYKALNAATGFQVLGLGTTGATIDASKLTGAMATHYSVSNGTEVINNISNGTIVDFTGATTSVTASPSVGQNIATFNLNTAATASTAAGFTTTALVTSGLATVNLTSNGTSANTITTLTVSANSGTTLTGADGLTITNWVGGASGDLLDASAFTGSLTLGTNGGAGAVATTVGDSGKGDVIKLGSGTSFVAMQYGGATGTGDTITLLAGHTKVDTIDSTKIAVGVNGAAYGSAAAQQTAVTKIANFNTSASASDILKIGNATSGAVAIGTAADINTGGTHTYTASNGFVASSGVTATQFLADVAASTAHTSGDVIAFNDGTNTWVVSFDFAATALKEHVIELVGVNTATTLATAAGANTIQLA